MELTDAFLALFIGGQLEVQRQENPCGLYRGDISGIRLVGYRELRVEFFWLAKKGYIWRRIDDDFIRDISLFDLWADNIGPGRQVGMEKGGDRFRLHTILLKNSAILIPPGSPSLLRRFVVAPKEPVSLVQ